MNDQKLNLGDFEKELNSLDMASLEKDISAMESDSEMKALDASRVKEVICRIYRKVRPVLKSIGSIWFIPASIKSAVNLLCRALDTLCGIS